MEGYWAQMKTYVSGQPAPPPPPPGYLDQLNEAFTLTFTQRLIGFIVCIALGLLCCFIAAYSLIFPRTFAKYYTLGSLFIITSSFFLVGPARQFRMMFDPSRLPAALMYILSMILTLYFALHLHRIGLSMVMIVVQVCAAIWYGASYVPFAQQCLSGTVSTILPTWNSQNV